MSSGMPRRSSETERYRIEKVIEFKESDSSMICHAEDLVRQKKVLVFIDNYGTIVPEQKKSFALVRSRIANLDRFPIAKLLRTWSSDRFLVGVGQYKGPLVSEVLREEGQLLREEATAVCITILLALKELHENQIFMSRIAPDVIMLNRRTCCGRKGWTTAMIGDLRYLYDASDSQDVECDVAQLVYTFFEMWAPGLENVRKAHRLRDLANIFPQYESLVNYVASITTLNPNNDRAPCYSVLVQLFLGQNLDVSELIRDMKWRGDEYDFEEESNSSSNSSSEPDEYELEEDRDSSSDSPPETKESSGESSSEELKLRGDEYERDEESDSSSKELMDGYEPDESLWDP